MEQAEAKGMGDTRTRNWRQTHTSETETLSLQPLPCLGPECVADTEMASSMWEDRERRWGAGRREGSSLRGLQPQPQRESTGPGGELGQGWAAEL